MADMIFSGFGGQGVLTAGLIAANIGMLNDKNVTWIPSYGSEMRGGTANCNVKISDDEISSPFVNRIDILVAMNQPSIVKFENLINENGIIIYNSSIIKNYKFREDINVYEVAATNIAEECENKKGANIVMLGALASVSDIFEKEVFANGVEKFFLDKGKNNPKNKICFEKGYEACK
ncbi:MAG: 2-oxoacid:acceptor oxidoreductase family protein [Terrisporobacter sp.]